MIPDDGGAELANDSERSRLSGQLAELTLIFIKTYCTVRIKTASADRDSYAKTPYPRWAGSLLLGSWLARRGKREQGSSV